MAETHRIGLIVNPIAGIGGRLAARGSDLFSGLDEARAAGGRPVAEERARRALRRVFSLNPNLEILAAAGSMGESAARAAGFAPMVLDRRHPAISSAADTRAAAGDMMRNGVDLILFAGGDGTARDIFDVVGDRISLVGIPTGVKMHSAVFALSPEAAGETASIAAAGARETRLAEIMDADEAELAAGRPSALLHGYARTPALPRLFQMAKASRPDGGEAAIEALGQRLAARAEPDRLILLGPGTTMALVKKAFGITPTLLGVDIVCNGRLVAADADASRLEALCKARSDLLLLVGIVGGQGFVFGRGNQQLSPEVLRKIGPANLRIIATREKLLALPCPELRLDTGDTDLDLALQGYRRISTGPNDTMMMRVSAAV
jgi:predicted polyphosphate/ATP-dependent NAD kinase